MIHYLLRCRRLAEVDYSFALGRLPHRGISHPIHMTWGSIGLGHPRLSLKGKLKRNEFQKAC